MVSVAGMCLGVSGGQAARIQHSAVKCSWVRALQYKSAVLSAFSHLLIVTPTRHLYAGGK